MKNTKCPKCGSEITNGNTCPNCGYKATSKALTWLIIALIIVCIGSVLYLTFGRYPQTGIVSKEPVTYYGDADT